VDLPPKRRNRWPQTFETLDNIDLRMIEELQTDARLRIAELGRRVGLSPPAVADRLRRLEDGGALSYRAEVDPRALGYTVCAIVRVSPHSGDLQVIPTIAARCPRSPSATGSPARTATS
jgi:Lrp/AsnC family leucine-responsive transcriptional regulator